jgi:CheY-like chemotaxis protein
MMAEVNVTDGALTARDIGKILIVDDEPSLRRLFQMVLSMEIPECEIDTACNGLEALEQFSINHHGVLIMDLHMPVMDGHTAFQEIEKMCVVRDWQMPAVVFCTGYAPPDTLSSVFVESPEHCVLSKPVKGEVIAQAVRERLHI